MHPNEALARREIDLIKAGDLGALEDIYASILSSITRAETPSGTHPVKEFLARFETLLGDGTLTRDLHDALGSDDHAVQLLRVTASARGVPTGTLSQFSTCGTDSAPSAGSTSTTSTAWTRSSNSLAGAPSPTS